MVTITEGPSSGSKPFDPSHIYLRAYVAAFPIYEPECSHRCWSRNGQEEGFVHDTPSFISPTVYFARAIERSFKKRKRLVNTVRQSLWSRTSSFFTEFLPDDLHAMTKLMLSLKDWKSGRGKFDYRSDGQMYGCNSSSGSKWQLVLYQWPANTCGNVPAYEARKRVKNERAWARHTANCQLWYNVRTSISITFAPPPPLYNGGTFAKSISVWRLDFVHDRWWKWQLHKSKQLCLLCSTALPRFVHRV